jgi:hypothetical protein
MLASWDGEPQRPASSNVERKTLPKGQSHNLCNPLPQDREKVKLSRAMPASEHSLPRVAEHQSRTYSQPTSEKGCPPAGS